MTVRAASQCEIDAVNAMIDVACAVSSASATAAFTHPVMVAFLAAHAVDRSEADVRALSVAARNDLLGAILEAGVATRRDLAETRRALAKSRGK